MSTEQDEDGQPRVEVTLTPRHARRLERHYPGALNLSEALRQASEEALRARESELTREDIREAFVDALEQVES